MGAFYTLCCHTDEKYEESAILCDCEVQLDCVSEEKLKRKLLRSPHTTTSFILEESDQELQAFITMRNHVDKNTEEWEKLNYDVYFLRCTHREMCTRWKKILLQLGYQKEVDSLLAVNKQSLMSDGNLQKAQELLFRVCQESNLFPSGVEPNDKFLFVMDRLVSLDSAEDFVNLAKEKYPKRYF